MTKLTNGLARVGMCIAVALAAAPVAAQAEGRGALSAPGLTGGFAAGAEQGVVAGGPERLYQARAGGGDALRCLTEALYFEARGESPAGQRAVAEVIMNRVDHPAFPKSVCGVVNQNGQFSYKGGSLRMRDRGAALRARQIAAELLAGAPRTLTAGATYFHTAYARPAWSRRFTRTARIGSHLFYRQGGNARIAAN